MNEDGREFSWSRLRWDGRAPSLPALDPGLMRLLLEHISTRVAVVGRDGRYVYANREALRFMGLAADQVIGHHMSEVLDDGVYRSFVPIFERLFAGESLQLRGWVDYQRQGRRYREQVLMPHASDGGVPECVIVCGLDHTEARLSEQQLAEKQSQLRVSEALKAAIFDHALAALISTDALGRVVEFNPSAEAMFGYVRSTVIGLPVAELIVPERFRAAHEAGLARVQSGGAPHMLGTRVEMPAQRRDGSEFPIEMVLFRTHAEGIVFFTAAITDLSERHSAARQIERQREALRQTEKLTVMGSLLAGVAHELNNPLAIVMGRATLLEEKCEAMPELKREAQRIHDAAHRCGRIVRTFLNMARSLPAERSVVSLNDVVQAAADTLGYVLRSHGIELELQLDGGLPGVSADGDQLGQVVLNLLINAQQALAESDGERRIRVATAVTGSAADAAGRSVELRIADSGPGVPPEVRVRLFEPFYTTKAPGAGTGLGLSVSRSVARQHGGELVLEDSGPMSGASFRLSLPVSETKAIAAAIAAQVVEAPALARLLVADDEPEIAALMRDMLEHAGYEVAVAESGAVALELLEGAHFDAVVSDLRMPEMDGVELWRELSQRHPALADRVLFITGDTLSPAARELLATSRCTGLDKPFDQADLLRAVAQLLR